MSRPYTHAVELVPLVLEPRGTQRTRVRAYFLGRFNAAMSLQEAGNTRNAAAVSGTPLIEILNRRLETVANAQMRSIIASIGATGGLERMRPIKRQVDAVPIGNSQPDARAGKFEATGLRR